MTPNVIKKSCPCPHSKGMKRNGGTAPLILDLDTNQLHVWPLPPRTELMVPTEWEDSWVSRVELDAVEKREMSCPWQE